MKLWLFKKKEEKEVLPTPVVEKVKEYKPTPPLSAETNSYVSPHSPGNARVMITNGGNHPPDLWAQVSAEHIAPIGDTVIGERRLRALALQADIAKILRSHYADIQKLEQTALDADDDHILTELDHSPHMEAIVADIQSAAKGTDWESHFNHDAVLELLDRELGVHIRTIKHSHRSWHLDRNPDHPHCDAFRGGTS